MRGRSCSRSPPKGYGWRGRSPSPRGRYANSGRVLTSLLVRNLHYDCREPRGIGFVEYANPVDAVVAKNHTDGRVLMDQELKVVYADEGARKTPSDMIAKRKWRQFHGRRRSPPRFSRSSRYSPSPLLRHGTGTSSSRSRDYDSPPIPRRYYSSIVEADLFQHKKVKHSRERMQERMYTLERSRSRSQPPRRGPGQGPARSKAAVQIKAVSQSLNWDGVS